MFLFQITVFGNTKSIIICWRVQMNFLTI